MPKGVYRRIEGKNYGMKGHNHSFELLRISEKQINNGSYKKIILNNFYYN